MNGFFIIFSSPKTTSKSGGREITGTDSWELAQVVFHWLIMLNAYPKKLRGAERAASEEVGWSGMY